jgi:hypothetical protein
MQVTIDVPDNPYPGNCTTAAFFRTGARNPLRHAPDGRLGADVR